MRERRDEGGRLSLSSDRALVQITSFFAIKTKFPWRLIALPAELAVFLCCRALRTCPQLQNVLLSIDTFHAKVAQQAVEAGVQLINDVSGGILDPLMHSTVGQLWGH